MPTTCPGGSPPGTTSPRLTRKMVLLVTVERSSGPSNGIDSRGNRLNPSSSSRTATSQQFGLAQLAASGSATLSPVIWSALGIVNRSLGNGAVSGALGSKRGWMFGNARAEAGTTDSHATAA